MNAGSVGSVYSLRARNSLTTKRNPSSSMKARLLLFAWLVAATPFALARDARSPFDTSSSPNAQAASNAKQERWEQILIPRRESAGLRLGKSDMVLGGPAIDGIRRHRPSADESLGRRFLGLPIVRLFVPSPSPTPPGGGRYFAWGESDRPWVALAEGGAAGRSSNDPVTHEAQSLISIRR